MAVSMAHTLFWDVTPCSVVKFTDVLETRNLLCLSGLLFDSEAGSSAFLRNYNKLLPHFTVSHIRRE
jgi:hypothetical protein